MDLLRIGFEKALSDFVERVLSREQISRESIERLTCVSVVKICTCVCERALEDPEIALHVLAFFLPVKLTALEIAEFHAIFGVSKPEVHHRARAIRHASLSRPRSRRTNYFGDRIRLGLKNHSMTANELARQLRCGLSEVMQWRHLQEPESAMPLATLRRIAKLLKFPPISMMPGQELEFGVLFLPTLMSLRLVCSCAAWNRSAARISVN